MSKLRYRLGLYGGKAARLGLKLLKRQGTYLPGVISAKLDPNYLKNIPKPNRMIAITGTNGKTTTSNLILDILSAKDPNIANNNFGSNTGAGIITTMTDNLTLAGKKKSELATLELDERWLPKVFRQVHPELLIVTNLYQDSYKRNAHTDFIKDVINGGLPQSTKLILNGDDLISAQIGEANERVFFSIAPLEGEVERRDSRLKDIRYCPKCHTELEWDFVRYHHIGQAHCPACGFKNPEAKYIVRTVDYEQKKLFVEEAGQLLELPLILGTTEAIYNQLAAYSALREFGLSHQELKEAMANLGIVSSRYTATKASNRNIYLSVAKRYNPIANSRAFDMVKKHPGDKILIMGNDDNDPSRYHENIAWFYDADFEYLKDPSIKQVVFHSWRFNDLMVRALMAGVPEEKIHALDDYKQVASLIDLKGTGDIFILHDIQDASRFQAEFIRDELVNRLEASK